MVESVAKAIASWTALRHAELDPTLPERYGSSWRVDWTAHAASQLDLLVQAISVRCPQLFTDAIGWTECAFVARKVNRDDLLASLSCLREVLESELPEPLNTNAADYVKQAIDTVGSETRTPESKLPEESPHRRLVLEYLETVLSGRCDDARNIVTQVAETGVSVPEIYEQILEPAQIEVGRMWHAGEINVADEHLASATTQSVMSLLRPRFAAKPKNGKRVIATSAAGDLHEIGVRMVADYFEIDGWNVFYLGANTPSVDVLEMLKSHKAELLALSVSTSRRIREVGELIEALRADNECAQAKVLVGGGPFTAIPDLYKEVNADGCAASARDAVRVGNSLISED